MRIPSRPQWSVLLWRLSAAAASQEAYNAANGITPKTIVKEISGMGVLEISSKDDSADKPAKRMSRAEIEQKINQLTREMREAAKILEFEHAAFLRDRIEKLRQAGGKENQALSTDKIVIKGAREPSTSKTWT